MIPALRSIKATLGLVALGFATLSVTHAPPALAQTAERVLPLKLSVFRPGINDLIAQVAKDHGIFEKNGLDVEFVVNSSGPAELATLISGEAGITSSTASLSFPLLQKKQACFVYLTSLARNEFDVIAQSGITSLAQLRGKQVGVIARGSYSEVIISRALREAGMDPAKDVQWVALGGPATAIAAFKNKRVDAMYLMAGMAPSLDGGSYTVVGNLSGAMAEGPGKYADVTETFEITTCEFAKKNPVLIQRFCASIRESFAFVQNPANHSKVVNTVAGLSKVTGSVADSIWSRYKTIFQSPRIDEPQWEAQAAFTPSGFLPTYAEHVDVACGSRAAGTK